MGGAGRKRNVETFTEALEFTLDYTARAWPNVIKHFDPVLIEEALAATGTATIRKRRLPAERRMRWENLRNACGQNRLVYLDLVTALRAHVVNGRIVVDEPVDLPDGAEVSVYLYDAAGDGMSQEERSALQSALERSLAQADAGELLDADDVLDELQRR